ncbi:Crp/Fnr family transcriptional regulator [Romboutsia weinsteinii]|uniref:Crp/Fnr family transcriptional regulator n=2 Tax=Romboutsia weinsteinii TaxID=2020949 RepID=A0A371J4M5_9FIRM|nr:Crp/Fnr family transcriptional regulator [Romboutsia weinsteinii]
MLMKFNKKVRKIINVRRYEMNKECKDIIDRVRSEFNENITEDLLKNIIEFSKKKVFKKGELILRMGEPMSKMYFIIKGIARSYYIDMQGNDVTKSFIKEYDFCIGESLFTNKISEEGFEALEDIVALEFDAKKIKEYLLSEKVLTDIYIKKLEETIIYKMNRENGFQIKSATERYLEFKRSYYEIENRVNQSCIASYLGVSPVSLSRIRRTIREE